MRIGHVLNMLRAVPRMTTAGWHGKNAVICAVCIYTLLVDITNMYIYKHLVCIYIYIYTYVSIVPHDRCACICHPSLACPFSRAKSYQLARSGVPCICSSP